MKLVIGFILILVGAILWPASDIEVPIVGGALDRVFQTDKPVSASSEYPVVEVIDGDTVRLDMNGEIESVRLVGINTPEVSGPYRDEECFGEEASAEAKRLLTGQMVTFVNDPTQDVRDQYDRLLGYIFLPDSKNFAEIMIESGHGYEFTFNEPYQYQADFRAAEQRAETNKLGLWAEGVCNE